MMRIAAMASSAGKCLALFCSSIVLLAGICFGQLSRSSPDWTQLLRNNMHRFNPNEKVLGVKNVGQLKIKWVYATGGFIGPVSPAVAHGVLYLFNEEPFNKHTLYALNAHTGGTLWTFPTTENGGSVAVANGMVYFSAQSVYALDARTGVQKWIFAEGDRFYGDPTVLDGVVYVGQGDDGNVYALNAETGAKLWSYQTNNNYSFSCPAVANGIVYFNRQPSPPENATLYALDSHTGKPIWTYSTNPYGGTSSPTVSNGLVYIPPDNGTIYALNAKDGSVVWSNGIGGAGYDNPPAIAYGAVYVICGSSNTLCALNARTGAALWSYSDAYNPSAVANGVVYVSCTSGVCALNSRDGSLLWSSGPAKRFGFAIPVVVDGMVYAGAGDRNIYAFGLK